MATWAVTWRHAAIDESTLGTSAVAISFLADVTKRYEHVEHDVLIREARETGFPLAHLVVD